MWIISNSWKATDFSKSAKWKTLEFDSHTRSLKLKNWKIYSIIKIQCLSTNLEPHHTNHPATGHSNFLETQYIFWELSANLSNPPSLKWGVISERIKRDDAGMFMLVEVITSKSSLIAFEYQASFPNSILYIPYSHNITYISSNTRRVPQGSILEPILYHDLNTHSKTILTYWDDMVIF